MYTSVCASCDKAPRYRSCTTKVDRCTVVIATEKSDLVDKLV
jgi:hypothetical protein